MNGLPRASARAMLRLTGIATAGLACLGLSGSGTLFAQARPSAAAVAVQVVSDEAEAVVAILNLTRRGPHPAPADWDRLFSSEGYRGLAARARSFNRPIADSAFRAFVLSDTLGARAAALERTLTAWRRADVKSAADRALRYLPAGTALGARVFLVIKPTSNSFVFVEDKAPPGIFLYVDPTVGRARLENTMAHELHHIGLRAACAGRKDTTGMAPVRSVLDWMGAFGEGRAMLAAAGGAAIPPHAVSPDSDRVRWDRDLSHAAADVADLERFFGGILDGILATEDTIQAVGISFFGIQGPWYTVGWLMAATVERTYGRARLVATSCDARRFLADYQAASRRTDRRSRKALPVWSDSLLTRLGIPPPTRPAR